METVICFGRQGVVLGNDCRGQLLVLYLLAFLTKQRLSTYKAPVMIYEVSCGDDPPETFFRKAEGFKNVRIFPVSKKRLFIAGSGKPLILALSKTSEEAGGVTEARDDDFFRCVLGRR